MLATLYVAKKYIMSHLAQACVNYLETSLSARNACVLLSQGRLFEELHLMQRCWEVIDAQAEEALRSEGFADIDHKTLETILSRETLNAREASVFVAVMRWAEAECKRRDMEVTAESKRQVTITGERTPCFTWPQACIDMLWYSRQHPLFHFCILQYWLVILDII